MCICKKLAKINKTFMDFSLSSFADAFSNLEFKDHKNRYFLYAFILATTSDKNIFPEIFKYSRELHELTSNYILVIGPKIVVGEENDIENVLTSGIFYNHYNDEEVDISSQIRQFWDNQTKETINFARFCGVELNKIPCIIFFSSLEKPKEYIIWQLKNEDASMVIRDFRIIMTKFEKEFACRTDLEKELIRQEENLSRNKLNFEWDYKREIETPFEYFKKLNESYLRKKEGINDPLCLYKKKWTRQIIGIEKKIEKENIKLNSCEFISRKEELERKFHKNKNEIQKAINETTFKIERVEIPNALDIIEGLDKTRYVRKMIKDLGKTIPILQLGLSVAKIFVKN